MTLRKVDVTRVDANASAADSAGIFGLPFAEADSSLVLVPVPWDATTSYRPGAARGPWAILKASRQVDLLDPDFGEFGLPRPWEFGIHLALTPAVSEEMNREARELVRDVRRSADPDHEAPDQSQKLERLHEHCSRLNQSVYGEVRRLLGHGKIVGVVGGDHSVSFGAIRAQAEEQPGLGILQIDAHADLRRAYEGLEYSHASIMHNVLSKLPQVHSLTQVAVRDVCDEELALVAADQRVTTFFDHELRRRLHEGETWRSVCESIAAALPERVYVSFDIDGLDPSLCPHAGTPVPGGLGFSEAVYLLKTLHRLGRKVVGFDLAEVASAPDGEDEWDGNVGARILYKLCALALLTQGARN